MALRGYLYHLYHRDIGGACCVNGVRAHCSQTHANHLGAKFIHPMKCELGFVLNERNTKVHTVQHPHQLEHQHSVRIDCFRAYRPEDVGQVVSIRRKDAILFTDLDTGGEGHAVSSGKT
jgi:hypothetical protein